MKKIISLILVLVLGLTVLTGCGKATMADIEKDPSVVVATIGDKDIYAYEMIYYLRMGATKEQALEQLYSLKATLIEAEKHGIVKGQEDIDAVNEDIKGYIEEYGEEAFQKELEAFQLTKEQFIDVASTMKTASRFDAKFEELGIMKAYTDDELGAYYDLNILKAKHILILTTDESGNALDDAAKAQKRAETEALLKQIREGADFDALMAEKSEDPGSKSQPEGYLFIDTAKVGNNSDELMLYQQYSQQGSPVGVMVEEFTAGTAALEVGHVSDIIETSYGYHIIKRLDARENPEDFNTVKEVIRSVKMQLDYVAKLDEWVNAYEKKEVKKYLDALEVEPYTPEQQVQPEVETQE